MPQSNANSTLPVELEQAWQLRDSQPKIAEQLVKEWIDGLYDSQSRVIWAYTHWRRGEFSAAVSLILSALNILRLEAPSIWLGRALGILAPIEGHLSRQNIAMELYAEQMQVAYSISDRSLEAQAQHGMGVILRLQNQQEHAQFHLEHALRIFAEVGDERGVTFAHLNLGVLARAAKRYADAIHHLEVALTYNDILVHPSLEALIRCAYLPSLEAMGYSQKVTQQEKLLQKLLKRINSPEDRIEIMLTLTRNSSPEYVIEKFTDIVTEIKLMGEHNFLPRIYHQLSQAHESLENHKKALEYLRLAVSFDDAKNETARKMQVETLEVLQRIKTWQKIAEREKEKSNKLQKLIEELRTSHARIAQMVKTDSLTGLYNRHHLFERGDEQIRHANSNTPLGVAMIDIDHFKKINDTYGHLCGDMVLQIIATIIREFCDYDDVPCRYGGEEFVLLRTGVNSQQLAQTSQQLLERVRTYPWQQTAEGLSVTMSIGVAHATSEHTFEALLHDADQRMYVAKNTGRNRVEWQA